MAVTKKIIGRIPICFGTWYAKQGGWGIKNRVTLYGSEFESLHENNTVPPAVYDEIENTVAFNENDWRVISNGTEAWLANAKIDALGTWEENPEFVEVKLDANGCVLWGIRKDGDIVFGCGIPSEIQKALNKIAKDIDDNFGDIRKTFHYETNSEYVVACIDGEGKFLYGVTVEGKFRAGDLEFTEVVAWLNAVFSLIEDPEGRIEATLDANDKLLSWRDSEGVKHETNLAIEHSLELSSEAMNGFQQALKDSGFTPGGGGDYSDTITEKGKKPVYIPMPRLARVNIIWDGNLTALSKKDRGGTQKVNYDVKVPVEFFDGQGVYFKKYALMSAQGNSSMDFIKKNISLKFFDTEDVEGKKKKWGKGDTFGTVFGDWVMQKTYHLKAFYTDFIRGGSEVAYQLADEVYKTRGIYADRPWKKALMDFSNITSQTPAGLSEDGINNMNLQIDNGARCMPDGFPVIVYQNGEFYGIFIWMLKKDADNFNMETDNPLHVHIDGDLYTRNFWGGTINWTKFKVRNPENLCYKTLHNGTYEYDADVAQDEIAGIEDNTIYLGNWTAGSYDVGKVVKKDSDYFINMVADNTAEPVTKAGDNKNTAKDPDFENKTGCGWVNCTTTVKVKQYIIDLSNRVGQINALTPTHTRPDETVITLNTYQGVYDDSKEYSRGNWVTGVDYNIVNDSILFGLTPLNPEYQSKTRRENGRVYSTVDVVGYYYFRQEETVNIPSGTELIEYYDSVLVKSSVTTTPNDNYYMSLHNGNNRPIYPFGPLDTEYWLDVTDDIAAIKTAIETYFDVDNLVDYQLINMVLGDIDGFGKNWQWTTWDGIKWYANQYDKDMAFGNHFTGMFTNAPLFGWANADTSKPCGLAIRYYTPEHKTRWQELVNAGIFNAEHIKSMITAWISRIGKDNFVQEWKRWSESPCNRNSKIDFEYWKFTGESSDSTPSSGTIWNASTSYDIGNIVWFKAFDGNWYLQFEAVKAGSNKPCLTSSYTAYPKSMGYRDSAWRFYKYIEVTISNQNSFINSL